MRGSRWCSGLGCWGAVVLKVLVVVFAVSLGAPQLAAQQKLDFSGTWLIVPGSGQPNGVGGLPNGVGGLGPEFTAVQDAQALTITTTQPIIGEMKLIYRLDGKPSTNALVMGPMKAERISTVTREGSTLVISSTVTMRGLATRTVQILWLENGDLVTEQTSEQGGRKEVTRARYRKK